MSMRWFPLEKRVEKVARMLIKMSEDPSVDYNEIKLERYNTLEEVLAILEDRPAYYKNKRKNRRTRLLDWLKVKFASLFYFGEVK